MVEGLQGDDRKLLGVVDMFITLTVVKPYGCMPMSKLSKFYSLNVSIHYVNYISIKLLKSKAKYHSPQLYNIVVY